MFVDGYMYWMCVVALFAYSVILNILFILALTYFNPFGSSKSVVDKVANTKKKNKSADRSSAATTPLNKGIDIGVRNTPRHTNFTSDKDKRRGMVLPFKPLSLAFEHVNYYVDMAHVAASMFGRKITVVRQDRAASDHPISKGAYLTNILLRVL